MDMAQIAGVALIFPAAAGVSLNWSWRLPRGRAGHGAAS